MKTKTYFNNPFTAVCLMTLLTLLLSITMILPLSVSADTSGCTLQIISGTVEVQDVTSEVWRRVSGIVLLKAGDSVRTGIDSSALLIFLDGSSMDLGPDTCISIKRVDGMENNAVYTNIKQFWGRTWNRVVKMINAGSQYDIETPSCHASVRGTYFLVDVSRSGFVTVQTFEGLVAVKAQDREFPVMPGCEVNIDSNGELQIPDRSRIQVQPDNNGNTKDTVKEVIPVVVSNGNNNNGNSNNPGSGSNSIKDNATRKGNDNKNPANSSNYMLIVAISAAIAIAIALAIGIFSIVKKKALTNLDKISANAGIGIDPWDSLNIS